MKKIDYKRVDKKTFEKQYNDLFVNDFAIMNESWKSYRDQLRKLSSHPNKYSLYPDDISAYFCMPYVELVDVYVDYLAIMENKSSPHCKLLHEGLKKLFHYSGEENAAVSAKQPLIADFFMKNAKSLGIHVCYYCEMSYINAYGFDSVFSDFAEFLMTASDEKIMHYIRKSNNDKISNRTLNSIKALRTKYDKSSIVKAFDDLGVWQNPTPTKSIMVVESMKNHFDLDHFLPKSECPLVSLSLYNFVPSCPTCNEKLKGADRIGGLDKGLLLRLSPTSGKYQFDDEIQIIIVPNTGTSLYKTMRTPGKYRLDFSPLSSDYQKIVDEFNLEERYNYHKEEALRLYDLYQDYTPAKIKMLQEQFGNAKTIEDIEDDIFGVNFATQYGRCFDKLKRDIKKLSGR